MRTTPSKDLLETTPAALSGIERAYKGIRTRILTGEYEADRILSPREIEEEFSANNTSTQTVLLRLAMEGLVKVLPIKKKTRQTNAALNEYRVANLSARNRMFTTRHGDFVSDVSKGGHAAFKETLFLEIEYADNEIAALLDIAPGNKVIHHRNLQRRDSETIVCINDSYLPFWFVDMLPELKKPDSDIYQLMVKLGKKPQWCTETVDIVQANTVEREMCELSLDDPAPMFKILRRSFDLDGTPLDVQFLTDRGDIYRLHYSYPLFSEGIPEGVRDK